MASALTAEGDSIHQEATAADRSATKNEPFEPAFRSNVHSDYRTAKLVAAFTKITTQKHTD